MRSLRPLAQDEVTLSCKKENLSSRANELCERIEGCIESTPMPPTLRGLKAWILIGLVVACPSLSALAAGKESSDKPGAAVSGPVFVKLPLFSIPVIEGDKVTRQVTVGIALELVEGLKADSIDEKRPAVIDAFFRDLYGMFGQRSQVARVAVEGSIKQRLGRTAEQILGPGVVRHVLVLQLLERPILQ
jgi:flagellar basal body-associated protein FliL